MIPPFDDNGNLPPGVHRATLGEIDERFGSSSEIRRVQMESIRWMVDAAVRAGILRIVLNGSFVTDIIEPNDVDCVLLAADDYPRDVQAEAELLADLPFLDIEIGDEDVFRELANDTFASDRDGVPKGVIEVVV